MRQIIKCPCGARFEGEPGNLQEAVRCPECGCLVEAPQMSEELDGVPPKQAKRPSKKAVGPGDRCCPFCGHALSPDAVECEACNPHTSGEPVTSSAITSTARILLRCRSFLQVARQQLAHRFGTAGEDTETCDEGTGDAQQRPFALRSLLTACRCLLLVSRGVLFLLFIVVGLVAWLGRYCTLVLGIATPLMLLFMGFWMAYGWTYSYRFSTVEHKKGEIHVLYTATPGPLGNDFQYGAKERERDFRRSGKFVIPVSMVLAFFLSFAFGGDESEGTRTWTFCACAGFGGAILGALHGWLHSPDRDTGLFLSATPETVRGFFVAGLTCAILGLVVPWLLELSGFRERGLGQAGSGAHD